MSKAETLLLRMKIIVSDSQGGFEGDNRVNWTTGPETICPSGVSVDCVMS